MRSEVVVQAPKSIRTIRFPGRKKMLAGCGSPWRKSHS